MREGEAKLTHLLVSVTAGLRVRSQQWGRLTVNHPYRVEVMDESATQGHGQLRPEPAVCMRVGAFVCVSVWFQVAI